MPTTCIQCDLVDGWHERNMKTVDKGNILSILRTLRRILVLFLAIHPIYWNLPGNAKRNDHCGKEMLRRFGKVWLSR